MSVGCESISRCASLKRSFTDSALENLQSVAVMLDSLSVIGFLNYV